MAASSWSGGRWRGNANALVLQPPQLVKSREASIPPSRVNGCTLVQFVTTTSALLEYNWSTEGRKTLAPGIQTGMASRARVKLGRATRPRVRAKVARALAAEAVVQAQRAGRAGVGDDARAVLLEQQAHVAHQVRLV